ncbi:MAG: hypothetical protein ACT4NY_01715 [Pseudonocardiales bacterium]
MQGQVETISPIIAIDGIKNPAEVITRFTQLAVAAKPGLRTVALYASPTSGIFFCRPTTFPGLRQLQELGLELVVPEGGTEDINEDFTNDQGDP